MNAFERPEFRHSLAVYEAIWREHGGSMFQFETALRMEGWIEESARLAAWNWPWTWLGATVANARARRGWLPARVKYLDQVQRRDLAYWQQPYRAGDPALEPYLGKVSRLWLAAIFLALFAICMVGAVGLILLLGGNGHRAVRTPSPPSHIQRAR